MFCNYFKIVLKFFNFIFEPFRVHIYTINKCHVWFRITYYFSHGDFFDFIEVYIF